MRASVVVIVIVTLILYLLYNIVDLPSRPFDVVYTWVAEHDPERDKYMGKKIVDDSTSVYRYNNTNELLYSIKSLKKYCNAVSTIYIVVKDGQTPDFIDFSDPSIKLIRHSEIMPISALPTFNSCAIELCLHKIPNLLNHYVYFNDDIFVNRKLKWRDLFTWWDGMPKVNFVKGNNDSVANMESNYNFFVTYDNTIRIANRLLKTNVDGIKLPHTPSVCYKPWEYEMEDILKGAGLWQETVESKFRENTNVILNNGFRTVYYLSKGAGKANWGDKYVALHDNCNVERGTGLFFCVNNISQKCQGEFKRQMEDLVKTA
jgi:hypothetical protein